MTREAIRMGDPHSMESISDVVNRYGAIKEETFNALVEWLDKNKDTYNYEIIYEMGNATIKTWRVGSFLYKHIDNQHDAQNSLDNINKLTK